MNSEYIRLSRPEKIYGEKNLLKAQMEILRLIKSFEKYKSLRKEELNLKILLKTKIDETQEKIKLLDTLLPKVKDKRFLVKQEKESPLSLKKRLSLEQQIEFIRKKIESLQ